MKRPAYASARRRAVGAAMVEFVIVAPLLGLFLVTLVQYGMLLVAQADMSYAALMAARAGSTGNVDPTLMRDAYLRAMVPWYGGGVDTASLAQSLARAQGDATGHLLIQVISPTAQAYRHWNDPTLQRREGHGRRVIAWTGTPPAGSAAPSPDEQSLAQARVLKLRIAQSFVPLDPMFTQAYLALLRLADPHVATRAGRFYTSQIDQDRLVLVSTAAVHLQSDAIESSSTRP